jgi:hypothetical protein
METKMKTERWLALHQIIYDRLLFDKPREPVFICETPSNAKYYKGIGDNAIIAELYEEWKKNYAGK